MRPPFPPDESFPPCSIRRRVVLIVQMRLITI